MQNHKRNILGIDISKKHFDVALLLPSDKRKNKKFPNNPQGFQALHAWLGELQVESLHACLEATNTYGHPLAEFLYDQGFDVSMVNPARVKGYGQGELLRTKTDKQDASLIARFCESMSPSLWVPEPKNVRELKALVRRVDSLIEMKQQEVNRLDVADDVVLEDIKGHIALLSSRIDQLRDAIRQHIDNDPGLREQKELLLSIPGIGEKTVAAVLSYFAVIERFSSAKKLASFCGVAPRQIQSGTSINRYGRMSKVGPAQLRKALFFPAMVALKYNPRLQDMREKLSAAGKPKMVIIGAAMRKLVHMIYGVLKSKVPFDADMGRENLAC
jgi:transposase